MTIEKAVTVIPKNCTQRKTFDILRSELGTQTPLNPIGQIIAEANITEPCEHNMDGAKLLLSLNAIGEICQASCTTHCIFNTMSQI